MNASKQGPCIVLATLVSLTMIAVGMAGEPATQKTTNQPSAKQTEPKASTADARPPVYKPPLRGAPGGRVGGGTRGTPGRDIFVLAVLAPDHTGLTTTEQPALFWYISANPKLPVELTIMDPEAVEPFVEQSLPPVVMPGVQRVRLSDLNVRLKPGVAYQWSVSVAPDPTAPPSHHILASGMIQVVEPPAGLARSGKTAPDLDAVRLSAENGLWYDALDAASQLMERAPGDQTARAYRDALLTQVGLAELARGGAQNGPKEAAAAR